MLAVVLSFTALFPRWLGGLIALRQRDRFHLVMGFAAGALLGAVAFETLPEGLAVLSDHGVPTLGAIAIAVLGAAAFSRLERPAFGHIHVEDVACNPTAGHLGAGGITLHAFLDGLAIGTAFQASSELGLVVSGAVLIHAFSDGLSTVTVVLRHGNSRRKALVWLAADAIAPVVGAMVALLANIPPVAVGVSLAFFAGMFVYLGAGSLLPAAHRTRRDGGLVIAATAAGFLLLLAVSRLG